MSKMTDEALEPTSTNSATSATSTPIDTRTPTEKIIDEIAAAIVPTEETRRKREEEEKARLEKEKKEELARRAELPRLKRCMRKLGMPNTSDEASRAYVREYLRRKDEEKAVKAKKSLTGKTVGSKVKGP